MLGAPGRVRVTSTAPCSLEAASWKRATIERDVTVALYAVLIYSSDSAHAPEQTADTSVEIAVCNEHADQLASAAVMTAAWAFTPRDMARAIRADGITDGPFLDAKEIVTGVYILEAPDPDTALAMAATNPVIQQGGGVEVRPVHSGGCVEQPGV